MNSSGSLDTVSCSLGGGVIPHDKQSLNHYPFHPLARHNRHLFYCRSLDSASPHSDKRAKFHDYIVEFHLCMPLGFAKPSQRYSKLSSHLHPQPHHSRYLCCRRSQDWTSSPPHMLTTFLACKCVRHLGTRLASSPKTDP